jgi:hypothetical protein
MKVRKNKKATNSLTALKMFVSQVQKSKRDINEILHICVVKDWKSFEAVWLDNMNQSNQNNQNLGKGVDADYLQELKQRTGQI